VSTKIILVLGTILSATAACGGSDDSGTKNNGDGDGGETATGGAENGSGGDSSGGSSSGGSSTGGTAAVECETTDCEGITLVIPLQPCCISATQCGVDVFGMCTDPSMLDPGDAGNPIGEPEVIVRDPACGDFPITLGNQTISLEGCCDPTGVCGVNIGSLPGGILPAACLTAEEGMIQAPPDAGPPATCNYPSDAGSTPVADSGTTPDASASPGDAATD
jgi:hypothetical protein